MVGGFKIIKMKPRPTGRATLSKGTVRSSNNNTKITFNIMNLTDFFLARHVSLVPPDVKQDRFQE